MSSTPQRQGLSKTQYLSNGVKSFRSVQTRLFAASAFLLVAAFFSVNVLAVNPNQSILATGSANTQQAGFVASAITDLLSFFGLVEAAPAVVVSPQVCVAPPAGMTAWFTGNGNTDDIAPADATTNTATLVGGGAGNPDYGVGRVGMGFDLNGTTDYVAVGPAGDADLDVGTTGTGISMDAWIRPDTITPALGQPIAEYGTPTETGAHFWHSVAGTPAGSLFVNLVDDAGGNHVFFSTGPTFLTLGALQHVAFTYNYATDIPALYINGVAQTLNVTGLNVAGANAAFVAETDYPLNIGARIDASSPPTAFFDGIIDEFELFNRDLAAGEVATIANATANEGKCSGTFQFSTPTQNTTEGSTLVVNVTRTGDLTVGGSVQVSTSNGAALSIDGTGCAAGNDFEGFSAANPLTLTFAPNDGQESVSVFICDDTLGEPNETFNLNLTNPTGTSSVGTPSQQVVTITDAADNGVSVSVTDPVNKTVAEDGLGNLVFTFTRPTPTTNPPGGFPLTVNFTISGTATPPGVAGADYMCTGGTCAAGPGASSVTFGATATMAQVTVSPIDDSDATEGNETVTFTVVAGAGYSVGAMPSDTGTITEDDTDVSVAVTDNDPNTTVNGQVFEDGAGVLTYTFTRTGSMPAGQVVSFSVSGAACGAPFGAAPPIGPCNDNFPADYTVSGATTFTGTNGTTPGTGTVTFGAGNMAVVTVDPTPDNNVELTAQTVTFTVTGTGVGVTPTIDAVGTAATGTILEDTTDSTFTVEATPTMAAEGTGNTVANPQAGGAPAGSFATFTVTRTGNLAVAAQVDIAAIPVPANDPLPANQRAMPGAQNTPCANGPADFILDGATLFFAPTVATQTFTVAVCGDNRFELNEAFDAILSNPTNGVVGVAARARYTIIDDDAAPVLNISDGAAVEGGNVIFTITQVIGGTTTPFASGVATTFRFCTVDVTATDGVDYTGQPCPGGSGVFTIAAGDTSTTISVPTMAEAIPIFEGPETFLVNLIDVTNATIGDGQGVGTITDGQQPNTFTVNDVAQAEGSVLAGTTSFNFVITRSVAAQGNQVVCYRTMAGNTLLPPPAGSPAGTPGGPNPATPGTAPGNPPTPANADYTEISPGPQNCVTFTTGGPDSIIVPVIVYQDQVFENDETFTFIIVSVTGGPAIPAANFSDVGIGTILNDDLAPILRVRTIDALGNPISSQFENVSPYRFIVERIGQSQLPVTFVFRTSDGSAPFAQPAGTGPATGGASPCAAPGSPAQDYLSNPVLPGTPTPPFTIAGGGTPDANGVSGSTIIGVTICNDAVRELDETFVGTISSPTNAVIIPFAGTTTGGAAFTANPSAAQARITDDDGAPIITVSDVALAEGNPPGTTPFVFTITLTGSTTLPVDITFSTVDGTAVAPGDYTATSGSVTFAPGETTKTVTVPVVRDFANEVDETFTLQVTSATNASLDPNQGADAVGLGTIINDDGPRTFAIDNVTQNEGNDPLNPTLFRFRVTGTGTSAFDQQVTFTIQDSNSLNSGLTATGGAACANPGTGAIDFTPGFVMTTNNTTTLNFAAGGTTFQDILVPVCGDTVAEGNETFTVTIASTVPGTVPPVGSVGLGTIVDDQGEVLSFRVDNVTGQEGNDPAVVTNFVFRISADGVSSNPANVSFVIEGLGTAGLTATGGAACGPGIDYIATPLTQAGQPAGTPPSPARFAAGAAFVNVTIRVCGDVVPELDETFRLRLTSTTNGTISATNAIGLGTIVNDDGPIVAQGIEGDINRTTPGVCGPGDGVHTTADLAQFNRFIAGLDTPCTDIIGPNNEFQRTDVAPEDVLGNGRLDAADSQQISNYIANLDGDRPAGGPTAPVVAAAIGEERSSGKSASDKTDDIAFETGGGREFRGVQVTGAPGDFVNYAVTVNSLGDETVTTLSASFDRTVLSISNVSGTNNNPDVTAGTGAPAGTSRTVNGMRVTNFGQIGVLLDFQGPLTAGTQQVVVFRFRILPTAAPGTYPVTFGDTPIFRSTSNAAAQSLPAKYTSSNVVVVGGPPVGRTLTIGTVLAPNGGQASVPVTLTNGGGNETALSGSITFPTGANGLTISNVGGTNPDVTAGANLPAGCTITTNATMVATGSIGFLIACPTAIPAGTAQLLRLRFGVPAGTPVPRTLALTWSDTPISRATSDANAAPLPTTYVNGAVNVDITTAQSATLSGRVTDANGNGIRNAMITISGVGLVEPITVSTGSLGYYRVENLEDGQTYLVSLRASKRFDFSNATRLVTLGDNAQEVDFVANPQ